MLDAIFSDVVSIFRGIFLGGDLIALAIALGAILVGALAMSRSTQVGSMTLLALTLFALGGFVRGFFRGPDPASAEATGSRAAGQIEASWAQFANMQAGTLLAYFIAFMLLILLIFGLKSVLSRG
jgi:hypothetical protein